MAIVSDKRAWLVRELRETLLHVVFRDPLRTD